MLGCSNDDVFHLRLDTANGVVKSTEQSSSDWNGSTSLFQIGVTEDVFVGARSDSDEVRAGSSQIEVWCGI